MTTCCNRGDSAAPVIHTPAWRRGVTVAIQWGLPAAALAIIPKCPACFAAYILLFTGLGLSLPAAAAARWTLIALSVAALTYLAWRAARRLLMLLF